MESALSDSVRSSVGAARAEVSHVVSHLWNRILVLIFPYSRFLLPFFRDCLPRDTISREAFSFLTVSTAFPLFPLFFHFAPSELYTRML